MWYNVHSKKDIRPEFIADAMIIPNAKSSEVYREQKLSRRFISWLFRHWYTSELSLWYYTLREIDKDEATWDERISNSFWVDLFSDGGWCSSQEEVDSLAKDSINDFRKAGHLKERCWVNTGVMKDGMPFMHIYCYGRDIHEFDLHLLMIPRNGITPKQYQEKRYNEREDPCQTCDQQEDCDKKDDRSCCSLCWYLYGRDRDCDTCEWNEYVNEVT